MFTRGLQEQPGIWHREARHEFRIKNPIEPKRKGERMLNKYLRIPAGGQREPFLSSLVDPFRSSVPSQRQAWKPKIQHCSVRSENMCSPTEADPKFWQIPRIRKFLESSGNSPAEPKLFHLQNISSSPPLLVFFFGDGSVGPWQAHFAVQ